MNWDSYLLEEKSPCVNYAHLGVLESNIQRYYDLAEIPTDATILDIGTPLKKFKRNYTNFQALRGHSHIEAVIISELSQERIDVLATLPRLQYMHLSECKQENLPNLAKLNSLKVLIISGLKKVDTLDFLIGMSSLKTLYIYGMNHLYYLDPLAQLTQLEELRLDHGKMSGTGKAIHSMQPLAKLINLKYLAFILNVENKNYDVSPLFSLKSLEYLFILPRYLKKGQMEKLRSELPKVTIK